MNDFKERKTMIPLNLDRLIVKPFERFIAKQSSSGVLLFIATILALIWANSPYGALYIDIWQHKIGFSIANVFELYKPVFLWINDGLMAVFFFLIGLEIKREFLVGQLSNARRAAFPIIAAFGGIIVPVGLFFLLNQDPQTIPGWGIPMATDIAFSLAILTLLGTKAPLGLKVFLTAFAIIDDIAAVLVIAVFYSGTIEWMLIVYSLILLVIMFILGVNRIYSKYFFFLLGTIIWILFLKSGIHPTVAGVLIAFTIPMHRKSSLRDFFANLKESLEKLLESRKGREGAYLLSHHQIEIIDEISYNTEKVQSPLQYLEHKLHGWVAFVILPIFALANAGVPFIGGNVGDLSLALSVGLSLVIGKSIGITLFAMLSVKMRIAELPEGSTFSHILGVGFLAGVGFTMSIFITNLAFTDQFFIDGAKIGILAGSFVAGLTGYLIIKLKSTVKQIS